ncbi:MAG: hypothetical protein R3E97_11470 [Candidatus Eisenbacteria bacterium]
MNRSTGSIRACPCTLRLLLGVASISLTTTVASLPTTARAEGIDPIVVWQEPVTIDSWPANGTAPELVATFHDGVAEVLFSRNGGIYHSQLSMADSVQIWSVPTNLSPEGSGAGHPALSHTYTVETMAIWHASSLSQKVIYSRSKKAGVWEGAELVSNPVGHAVRPVAAALEDGGLRDVVVAWEDSTSSGWQVRARIFPGGWITPGWADLARRRG